MENARKKFQDLLRELFQFDCADLDFGIYRIMNQKRALIEQFIEKDLLDTATTELKKGALKEQGDLAGELQKVAAKIRDDIADDAIDADGKLDEKHKATKLGKQYLELQEKAAGSVTTPEQEAQVFNHLWAFFSRYYDNGDFLSTRRYSRREKYTIPYNGEEVYLHWANRDQYYIKTGENFTDYQWKAGEISVLFKLVQAESEKDNIKADIKRYFVPRLDDVSVEKKTVTIPFEYRGLTEQEAISYGKKNQQDAIVSTALESLPKRKALRDTPAILNALMAEYRKTDKGESVSRMEHHLRRYTAKNTRDYFIHKDLAAFLRRELDFYLKNEVLALDDLEAGGEKRADGWFQLLQAIRSIGGKIIAFMAQIEDFQKRVFEKRKFVTETNYCFTLDRVPKTLWPAILKNKAQIAEWKKLYSIADLKGYSDPLKQAFLEAWPALMIDTKFFDTAFTDELMAASKDIEESLGGLLVHSENFQALMLLAAKHREDVECIYIDPPYNTSENTFVYKNSYKHSSWLAMMGNRVSASRQMLPPSGVLQVAIDDTETGHLRKLLDDLLGDNNRVATIAAEVNPAGQNLRPNTPALSHDYCHVYAVDIDAMTMLLRELTEDEVEVYDEKDENGSYVWDNLRRRGGNSRPINRPGQWFPLFITGDTVRVPKMDWDEVGKKWVVQEKPAKGETEVWPVDPKGEKRIWRVNPDGARRFLKLGGISVTTKAGRLEIIKKSYMPEGRKPKTLWKDPKYSATTYGTKLLNDILGKQLFSYPKSLHMVMDCLRFWVDEDHSVLDFFAGSGTTGHAIIKLNQEDGGCRKFLLAEMGEYFDSVLVPRIKKVVFCSDWKGGKPVPSKGGKSSGISHAFKYIRLESYEDALGNIAFDAPQRDLKFDDYTLRYMLDFETRKSETLLNVEKLAAPFSYQLDITEGGERRSKPVDLPETFNYLLGLKVSRRTVHMRGDKHRYLVIRGTTNPHGEGGEREVVVIWRDVTGWKAADFKADADFVKKEKLAEGADDVFVNADGVIPDARVLDPIFKERMFAPINI